jgi:hypothetical protein
MAFWAAYAFATATAVEVFFVRPAGVEYGTGDGSSYENAWSGFKGIKWGSGTEAGKVDAGDTLYICGTHSESLSVSASGIENAFLSIRGDSEVERGVIDGKFAIKHAVIASTAKYLVLSGIEIKNVNGTAINLYAKENVDAVRNIKIVKCVIHDGNNNGIAATGTYVTVDGCHIFNMAYDGIYVRGEHFTATNNDISDVAMKGGGDCIQLSTATANCLIQGNKLTNMSDMAKQCIIISGGRGPGVVERNYCRISTSPSRSHFPIQVRVPDIDIRYNVFEGGNWAGTFLNGKIYYNIFKDATEYGIRVSSASGIEVPGKVEIYNNVIYNCQNGLLHDSETQVMFVNNIVTGCSGYGIKINTRQLTYSGSKNNIVAGCSISGTKVNNTELLTYSGSNNCIFNNWINYFGIKADHGSIEVDPGFVAPEHGDFMIRADSPIIGKGVRIEGLHPVADLGGVLAGADQLPTIGAFEPRPP